MAAEENPEITYTVQNEGIVSNERKLRKILNTGRTSYVLPNSVKVIQNGAFEGVEGTSTLIMPGNGSTVELEAELQAASAPAVTPLMAAAAAIFRKPLREILFIGTLSFSFLFLFFFSSRSKVKTTLLNL